MGRLTDVTVSALLANKLIRTYLSPYSDAQVQEALKLTLLYGIIHIQHRYPGQTLDLLQLKDVVRRCGDASVLEDKLPSLQQEILNLEQQLKIFRCEVLQCDQEYLENNLLAINPQRVAEAATYPAASRVDPHSSFPGPAHTSSPPQPIPPSSTSPSPAVYPAWWGDSQPKRPAVNADPKPPRPQPRLAYSMQPAARDEPVDLNDLVTTSYLDVRPKVSSYAAASLHQGDASEYLPASQQDDDALRVPHSRAAAGRPQQPPQSKVKQQVAESSQRHDSKQRQHRQRLMSVITTASVQPEASAASSDVPAIDDSRPAQIAEKLMSNPWTSWFMQPSRKRQLLHQQGLQQHPLILEAPAADADVDLGTAEEMPCVELQPAVLEDDPEQEQQQQQQEEEEEELAGLLRSSSQLVDLQQPPVHVLREADINQEGASGWAVRAAAGAAAGPPAPPNGWSKAFDMSREAVAAQQARAKEAAAAAARSPASPAKPGKGWVAAYDMTKEAQLEAAAAAAAAAASSPSRQPGSPLLVGRGAGTRPPGWSSAFDVSKEGRDLAKRLLREAQRQR